MRTLDSVKLQRAKTNQVDIRIGDYLNQSFSIFSQHWLQFMLFAFVSMILSLVSAITIVGPYFIMFPLQMGYGHVIDKIENKEEFVFNDFFIGFKQWTKFIPLLLLFLGLIIILFIPIIILGGVGSMMQLSADMVPFFGISLFALIPVIIILGIVVSAIVFLVPYVIYYGNIGVLESIKVCININKNNFWYLLLFVPLFSIISQIGTYLCLIGVFASIPIAYIMAYLLVKDILLTDDKNEIDTIGQS